MTKMDVSKNKTVPETDPNMEEKILAAAEKLFLENGFQLTSTTQIASEAGCNQALVHYYFRTKEKLFNHVLRNKVKEVFTKFLSVDSGEGTFLEKLSQLIGLHFDIIRENSQMVLFLLNEFGRDSERFKILIAEIGDIPAETFRSLDNELKAEIKAGKIRQVRMVDIVMNAVSLNAFVFAGGPLFAQVWKIEDMDDFYDLRKQEIIKTILLSLRP